MLSQVDGSTTEWLLEIALKSTILFGLAVGIAATLKKRSARARYVLWSATLVGALVIPVLAGLFPKWRLPILPGLRSDVAPASARAELGPHAATPEAIRPPGAPVEGEVALDHSGDAAGGSTFHATLLVGWLVGVGAVVAWLLAGIYLAFRFVQGATPLTGGEWRGLVTQARRKMSLSGRVRVLKSDRVPTPMTWGVWRPVVLMPGDVRTWPGERRRIVLLHELVHVKRRDWLLLILGQLACAVYWFHPLVWLCVRRMALERERACDDDVLALGTRPSEYARHLLDVARNLARRTPLQVTTLTMSRSLLEERVRSIVGRRRRRRGQEDLSSTVVSMASLVLGLAVIHPFSSPAQPAPSWAPGDDGQTPRRGAESVNPATTPTDVDTPPAVQPPQTRDDAEEAPPPDGSTQDSTTAERPEPESEGSAPGRRDPEPEPRQARPAEPEEDARARRAMSRAHGHREEERWEEAILAYRAILREDLQNAEAWYWLGYSYLAGGDPTRAIAAYEKAARFEDVRPNALYNLACCFARSGEDGRALEALGKSLDAGFHDWDLIDRDEDLDSIRKLRGFEEIARRRPE